MQQLLANGDKHMNEEKATRTVRTTLLGWPDRARAHCGKLRCRRALGGVNGVEMRMVAKFGTLGQTREASTREQSARRHPEHGDKHAGIMDMRGHRVNSSLRPTNVQRSCLA